MAMKMGNNRDVSKVLKAADKINPARLQLNMHPALHEQFRKLAFNADLKMSDLITEYVIRFVREQGGDITPEQAQMYMSKPSEWE
ncbi:hypothetical protein D8V62_23845 [Salmonella enterica]|nr:hypothetical protein [Salmonella enterica]EJJ2366494.1 hypothetical protein [Salmonella enterica]